MVAVSILCNLTIGLAIVTNSGLVIVCSGLVVMYSRLAVMSSGLVVMRSRSRMMHSGLVIVMRHRRAVMYVGLCNVTISIEARITMAVAALVCHKHLGMCVIEMPPVVVRIDSECPIASLPSHRAIEVDKAHVLVELPGVQHEAEVSVAAIPPDAEDITVSVQAHQVVEVDLINSLILCSGEVQFVSHLVAQEESLVLCCVIVHCVGRDGHDHHHCQNHHLLHILISYTLNGETFISFSRCKDRNF